MLSFHRSMHGNDINECRYVLKPKKMWIQILQDGLFAAIAAIGFAAISRPPKRAYLYCAIIAAVGHASRYMLMSQELAGMHIIPATLCASFIIGMLAVFLSPVVHAPAETCLFPALLPMIPGIYAYKAFGGLAMCILCDQPSAFQNSLFLFAHNALTCGTVLLVMVIGATIPIFIFKKVSFQATR